MTERHKFSVGAFQGWLCGPQHWEVRHRDGLVMRRDGLVMRRAKSMMECARLATRFNDQKKELDEAKRVLEMSNHHSPERVEQARATIKALIGGN